MLVNLDKFESIVTENKQQQESGLAKLWEAFLYKMKILIANENYRYLNSKLALLNNCLDKFAESLKRSYDYFLFSPSLP